MCGNQERNLLVDTELRGAPSGSHISRNLPTLCHDCRSPTGYITHVLSIPVYTTFEPVSLTI